MSVQPTITYRGDGGAVLVFPYDAWLVDALKSAIPAYGRRYDPIAKSWTVTSD